MVTEQEILSVLLTHTPNFIIALVKASQKLERQKWDFFSCQAVVANLPAQTNYFNRLIPSTASLPT